MFNAVRIIILILEFIKFIITQFKFNSEDITDVNKDKDAI